MNKTRAEQTFTPEQIWDLIASIRMAYRREDVTPDAIEFELALDCVLKGIGFSDEEIRGITVLLS